MTEYQQTLHSYKAGTNIEFFAIVFLMFVQKYYGGFVDTSVTLCYNEMRIQIRYASRGAIK